MDYVYAAAGDPTCLVQWGVAGNCVTLHFGEVWYADDPFVVARPDLFSSAPPVVHSTTGREHPQLAPVGESKRRGRARG